MCWAPHGALSVCAIRVYKLLQLVVLWLVRGLSASMVLLELQSGLMVPVTPASLDGTGFTSMEGEAQFLHEIMSDFSDCAGEAG